MINEASRRNRDREHASALEAESAWADAYADQTTMPARDWFAANERLLKASSDHAQSEGLIELGIAFNRVGAVLGYIAIGQLGPVIENAIKGRGQKRTAPDLRSAKSWIAAYRQACRPEGLVHKGETIRIKEAKPIAVLETMFEQSRKTMQEWARPEHMNLRITRLSEGILLAKLQAAADHHRKKGIHKAFMTRD